jgi:uncharacterized protein (DUF1778 family)
VIKKLTRTYIKGSGRKTVKTVRMSDKEIMVLDSLAKLFGMNRSEFIDELIGEKARMLITESTEMKINDW